MESLRGKLLIASPSLEDPNFSRTVVLIAEHSADGAMGVVLNRDSPAPVEDAAPGLQRLVDEDAHVFVGGPVQPSAAMVLAEFDNPQEAGMLVFEDVGFLPVA